MNTLATVSPTPRAEKCVICGYTLESLAQGPYGEIKCPECGVKNLPKTTLQTNWGNGFGWSLFGENLKRSAVVAAVLVGLVGVIALLYLIFR